MQRVMRRLVCPTWTSFWPSLERWQYISGVLSDGLRYLQDEQVRVESQARVCIHRPSILGQSEPCVDGSARTGRLSSAPVFASRECCFSSPFWNSTGLTVPAKRVGTRSSCGSLPASSVYGANDGAVISQATKLLHTKGL
jgi:hypothetical protein